MRNENDAYYTPPPLTKALLCRINNAGPLRIAEPCAGDNWIADVLRDDGHEAITGDIDEAKPVDHAGLDFFCRRADAAYAGCDTIITNPPFSGAPRYVRRALEITPRVAMLLRLTFLEPCESRPESARAGLLQQLSRVVVLPRVSFYQGASGTDSATCAWFIWGEHTTSTGLEIVTETELAHHAGQQSLFSKEAS